MCFYSSVLVYCTCMYGVAQHVLAALIIRDIMCHVGENGFIKAFRSSISL